jgi:hypothetical protein
MAFGRGTGSEAVWFFCSDFANVFAGRDILECLQALSEVIDDEARAC